jgi:homospermidine synthase
MTQTTTTNNPIPFNGKILFIGFGAVARCTLPMILAHINIPCNRITVLDFEDKTSELTSYIEKGLTFTVLKVDQANIDLTLNNYLARGDLLIDLAWEIDTLTFLTWCNEHGVLYINASVEEWDPYGKYNAYEETLYYRHMRMREVTSHWLDPQTHEKIGPTAVLDHGANPGLISHFVKKAIMDIAERCVKENKLEKATCEKISVLMEKTKIKKEKKEAFAMLSMLLDIKVIHCSERDTQITNKPKELGEFVNTWSVEGLHEEGIAPAEMGWGTHEEWMPSNAEVPNEGPKNNVYLKQCGMNTFVRSFVPPHHQILGMVIRHGEALSISEHLSVQNEKSETIYRPTVHYAYMPCDQAISSLQEVRSNDHQLPPKIRILKDDEIVGGSDILGALVMGHAYNSWWTGSDLNIDDARKLVSGQNSTVIQVGAGMVAAILWMIENPNEGVCVPDDLPYDYVLNVAKPYLGNFISSPYDWTPLKTRKDLFAKTNGSVESSDPWQFSSFLYNS